MKLEDLQRGQIIELRWEYWNHDMDTFEPRKLHAVLLRRNDIPSFDPPTRARGWIAKVIYDSHPKTKQEFDIPYDNTYYDTWLVASINEGKLAILSDPGK